MQTRGGVICRPDYGSSKDQAVIANWKYLCVSCRLPNNLRDPVNYRNIEKWLTLRLVLIARQLLHDFLCLVRHEFTRLWPEQHTEGIP
jgi:hypothetical protein